MRNRYSAYINFDTEHGHTYKVLECGIKIRKLEDVDYGAWQCDLRIPYDPLHYGSVLRIDHSDSREDGNTRSRTVQSGADEVHVKRGDPFTVNSRRKPKTTRNTRWFVLSHFVKQLCMNASKN